MKIRRVGPYILSLFAAGIFLQKKAHFSGEILWGLLGTGILFGILFLGKERKKTAVVGLVLLCFFSFTAGMLRFWTASLETSAFTEGEKTLVHGRVVSAEIMEKETLSLVVWARGEKLLCRVEGDFAGKRQGETAYLVGRRLSFSCLPQQAEEASNPGAFDYREFLRSEGILMRGQIQPQTLILEPEDPLDPVGGFLGLMAKIREKFLFSMTRATDEKTAGIAAAMLFGDTSLMDESVYQAFQENGTAHVIAVSGMHVGIVFGCIRLFLQNRGKRTQRWINMIALAAYTALCGFSVSVLRAAVMIFICLGAEGLFRRYDMLSAACATGLLFLLANPYTLFHAGFLLSFTAVVSLGVMCPALPGEGKSLEGRRRADGAKVFWEKTGSKGMEEESDWKRRLFNGLRPALWPMLAVQLGVMPLVAYLFYSFSPAAFLANIPAVFFSGIVISAGMALLPLCFLPDFLSAVFEGGAAALGIWIRIMVFFNDLCSLDPWGHGWVASPCLWSLLAYYAFLALLFSEWKFFWPFYGKKARIAAAAFLIAAAGIAGTAAEERNAPSIVFVDVGQGDCIHIRTPRGENYLIDGGGNSYGDFDVGREILLPYLLKNGVTELEGVFVTHMDGDHYKGIASVCEEIPVHQLYLPQYYETGIKTLSDIFSMDPGKITFLHRMDRVVLEEQVSLTVLHPGEEKEKAAQPGSEKPQPGEEEENAQSLVMRLSYGNTKILLTGDIGEEEEKEILESFSRGQGRELLKCDVLKLAHHGSRFSTSQAWLSAASPKAAVSQSGENNAFGHPHPSVIERCEKNGIMVFRTDTQGAVCMWIGERGFSLKTGKNAAADESPL